ncbi:hypothetical protein [Rhodococcus wratislaviensis]|uniref:Uncharacterized protein n=1 Tax=Rhodococcus wratislaviensis NBRC 100605 TaxID=1219028 RepID=X0RE34_RHOWR|nr:hypothetical protein [Rhodococcus wratislaviensis]GAF49310.1 hypothetical protein RW1_075_00150 [Rhodococcus wratislaviensis NBRC 100605]
MHVVDEQHFHLPVFESGESGGEAFPYCHCEIESREIVNHDALLVICDVLIGDEVVRRLDRAFPDGSEDR